MRHLHGISAKTTICRELASQLLSILRASLWDRSILMVCFARTRFGSHTIALILDLAPANIERSYYMFLMAMDPVYLVITLISLLMAGVATYLTKSTFKRYSKQRSGMGLTGAQAAQRMLNANGISDVNIEPVQGFLSDHYDPRTKTLRLSPEVYSASSLSALGVACHEAGHALQHAQNYAPLAMRSALVPAAQFGSHGSYIFMMLGYFLHSTTLFQLGALVFVGVVLFSLVTLPVEWDASARAKKLMLASGIVTAQEGAAASRVLNAAFLTYVASAVSALLTLLYFLLRSGLLGGSDD
jgi:Zn-dependent membrane protease YugP